MDRYEEALAMARAEYEKAREQGYTWLMALLEGMFPEIQESGDERIRQAIIAVVQWAECFNASGVTHEAAEMMLAWLERKKDERELGFIEGKVEGVRQTCQEIKDAMSLYEPKVLNPFESTFRGYIDSAIRYCMSGDGYQQYIKEWAADLLNLEKQKEQKFTEKQDYSDLTDLERAIHRGFLVVGVENVPVTIIKETAQDCLAQMKPAEWSEKDELMRGTCIYLLEHDEVIGPWKNCIAWLKSLRPPQYCENCKLKRSVENWKPSKVQIGTLKQWIQDHELDGDTRDVYPIFYSLLTDLQKLL